MKMLCNTEKALKFPAQKFYYLQMRGWNEMHMYSCILLIKDIRLEKL